MLPSSFDAHSCMYHAGDEVDFSTHSKLAETEQQQQQQRYWATSTSQATDLTTCSLPCEQLHFPGTFSDFNGNSHASSTSIFNDGSNPSQQQLHFDTLSDVQAKQEMLAYQALCQAELFRSEKTPHRTQFQRENHILAERQRREEMNEKFTALKALLPKSTKKDKASIVGETINYVLELEKKLKALQTVASSKGTLHRQKRRALEQGETTGQDGNLTVLSNSGQVEGPSNKPAQVELQSLGAQAVLKMICLPTPGLVMRILATLESCKAEVVQSNISTLGSHAIFFFTIELRPGASTTTEDLIAALEVACSKTD